MATIKSLGIHKPSAFPYLIADGLLPPDPPATLYKWQTIRTKTIGTSDVEEEEEEEEEEILSTRSCVVWSRAGVIRRVFRFDVENEEVVQAVLTTFPASYRKREVSVRLTSQLD